MGKKASYCFLKDPENAWIPAKLLETKGKTADVQIPLYRDEQSTICDGGKTADKWVEAEVDLTDYNKQVLPMQNVDETGDMLVFPDMVELPFLHEVCIYSRAVVYEPAERYLLCTLLVIEELKALHYFFVL